MRTLVARGLTKTAACKLLGLRRQSIYETGTAKDDTGAIDAVRALATTYPGAGYRMLHAIHRNSGGEMNHKKFHRIYRQEMLTLRRRRRRKIVRERVPLELPAGPGMTWSMDFVHDRTEDGRRIKILTIVDDFSKECIWLEVDRGMGGASLVAVLATVMLIHGKPQAIRSDNGPEFTSREMALWLISQGIRHLLIQPGKPTQNAYCESFNGRLREECLNMNLFLDLEDARQKIEAWRDFYNEVRPHSSLAMRSPRDFIATLTMD